MTSHLRFIRFSYPRCAVWLLAALVTSAAGPISLAQESGAADPRPRPTKEQKVQQVTDYLVREYVKRTKDRDWITRSVAVISLAQFPTEAATTALVERVHQETHTIGRLVAWQALMARASILTEPQFTAWRTATTKMVKDGLFHGDLRIGLLEMLSSMPLTVDNRKYAQSVFIQTNSLDSSDVPTLVALGKAVERWGDADLVEDLMAAVPNKDHGIRAKLVLKVAGFGPALGAEASEFQAWWKDNKAAFTKNKPGPNAWKKLKPQYIAAPTDLATMDPDAKQWHQQLELTAIGLRDFDFAISIDCSRSMGGELARLKRDMQVMYAAFAMVALEPRVGITGFAPGGEVKNFPLNGRKSELLAAVQKLDIFGPAGEEEWAGGLEQCIKGSDWHTTTDKTKSRRVIAIISDEPITPAQHDKLVPIVKKAAADGFRIYAVMIFPMTNSPDPLTAKLDRDGSNADDAEVPRRPRPLAGALRPRAGAGRGWASYEELTQMAGGDAIACKVPQGTFGLGTLGTAGPNPRQGAAPSRDAIAPIYPGGGPTVRLLTMVLTDAINPQYAERVEPLVKILVNHSQHAAVHIEEKR